MHLPEVRRGAPDLLPPTLLLLTVTTGLVDAVSFLGLGHIFTANMTGNVVFLAFALAGSAGLSIGASLLAIGCFLGGALGGGRLARVMQSRSPRRWLVTAAGGETLLLASAAVAAIGLPLDGSFGRRWPVVGLTAGAMGLRNSTVRRLGVADLTTTVLTLTLTGLAADSSLAGGTNPRPARRVGSVVAMFSGALLGAVLVLHQGLARPSLSRVEWQRSPPLCISCDRCRPRCLLRPRRHEPKAHCRAAEACRGRPRRKSHANASDRPLWIAAPLTAAIVGLSMLAAHGSSPVSTL